MTGTTARRVAGRLRRVPLWRVVVAVVVAALVVVGVVLATRTGSSPAASTQQAPAADNRTLLDVVTRTDPAVVRAVAAGGVAQPFTNLGDAPPLTGATGRPEVLFVAEEGCAACAAQRWSMVMALSRFGTLGNVLIGASVPGDGYPTLATFSFRGVHYSSAYVDLVAVETKDRDGKPLQSLTADQQQLLSRYDTSPHTATAAGSLPWLDVGNRYATAGSGYPPQVILALDWAHIAQRFAIAGDAVTQSIVGNANWITAAICARTGMQPASVCASAPISELVPRLP